MAKGIIGKKLGMTQVFRDSGIVEPVTAIEAGPCTVVQIKTEKNDGYNALQIGYGQVKKVNSEKEGNSRDLGNFRYLREFRSDDIEGIKVGDTLDVSLFEAGDLIDVTGVSKGKGFAGVIKRHGFSGGPKTHGQSDRLRHPGSIGAMTTPGRVLKGKKMAGHMGSRRVTVRKLEVFQSDQGRNILLVKGAVPGARNGMLLIRKSGGRA